MAYQWKTGETCRMALSLAFVLALSAPAHADKPRCKVSQIVGTLTEEVIDQTPDGRGGKSRYHLKVGRQLIPLDIKRWSGALKQVAVEGEEVTRAGKRAFRVKRVKSPSRARIAECTPKDYASIDLPMPDYPSPARTVPITISSNPGARAKLFLNFGGGTVPKWGSYGEVTAPAFDVDGDESSFSNSELDTIREITERVADAFSPFNIDVTTIDPSNLEDGKVMRVDIGGDGAWLGAVAAGATYVGAFTDSALINIGYVFPRNLANGNAKYTAAAIAHEAGHAFGLRHQTKWNGDTLEQAYLKGDSLTGPIMGAPYLAERALWWHGTSTSPATLQDDLEVLSSTVNGFGFRPDDHGTDASAASIISDSPQNALLAAGVIEKPSDADVFSFITGGGPVNLTVSPFSPGGMLALNATITTVGGAIVSDGSASPLGGVLPAVELPAGRYLVTVNSKGGYGDIGSYSVSGTIPAAAGKCIPVEPQLELSEPDIHKELSENGVSELRYTVTLTNLNSEECGTSKFFLEFQAGDPLIDGKLSGETIALRSNDSAEKKLRVISRTPGKFAFSLVAVSAAGKEIHVSATANFDADDVPPAAPTILRLEQTSKTSTSTEAKPHKTINVSWSASTDDRTPSRELQYVIYRNGEVTGRTRSTSFQERFKGTGKATYQVEAVDEAGNVSALSAPATLLLQ